ncbi:caspase domain-containing protein [Russula compacta]|nr:caspase domain-containing protein [Russula compacta]
MGTCLSALLPSRVHGISRRASRDGSTDRIDDVDHKEESSTIQQIDSFRKASLKESTDLPEIEVREIEDSTTKQLGTSRSTSSKQSAPLPDDEDHNKKGTTSPKGSAHLPIDEDHNKKGTASPNGSAHLPVDEDQKKEGPTTKRRALLIGITYSGSKTWSELDGPHHDVDHYQELLTSTYGYRPEDITILKDLREFPEHSQPTRVNMIRELKALVSGAAPGDHFTLFYSGHSDQRVALKDLEEEDGMDERAQRDPYPPLPVGSSLLAILDTCHSGTLLDLPHYHCNNVYVPWQSKGERRTMTMQNINVRRQATGFADSTSDLLSIASVTEGQRPGDRPSDQPLEVDIQFVGDRRRNKRDKSPGPKSRVTRRPRPRERMLFEFESQVRYASPEPSFACDGWCDYSEVPHPNVLSLSACSDLQRAWEGPKGSLTTVLCNYLKKNNYPSYGAMMTHINFQLHDNALALHAYTRDQRKKAAHGEGDGFLDGDLDNFQEPELSSLGKLNMEGILQI